MNIVTFSCFCNLEMNQMEPADKIQIKFIMSVCGFCFMVCNNNLPSACFPLQIFNVYFSTNQTWTSTFHLKFSALCTKGLEYLYHAYAEIVFSLMQISLDRIPDYLLSNYLLHHS